MENDSMHNKTLDGQENKKKSPKPMWTTSTEKLLEKHYSQILQLRIYKQIYFYIL